MGFKMKKDFMKAAKSILVLAIAGIMFVPMLYSTVYLGAIWDAYGEIGNVPVAFVNNDKPYKKDGKEYFIGAELENNLKDNDKVDWKFVDYGTAMSGLEGTGYYAVIEIPEGFSEKIANARDGELRSPEITYTANKGRNFIFSQISEKIAQNLKAEVASGIQEEISKVLVESLYDVKVSLKDAGDGTEELVAGQQELLVGSAEIQNGMETAASGSEELGSGMARAASATALLQEGTSKLYDGSKALSAGLNTAADGSEQLQKGLLTIADGEKGITAGSVGLVNGLNELKSGLTQENSQIPMLVSGAADLNQSAADIEAGAEKLDSSLSTGLNSLADGVGQASEAISRSSSALNSEIESIQNSDMSREDKDKIIAAISAIDKVSGSDMSSTIEAPLRGVADSAQPLVESLRKLNEGTAGLASGMGQLASTLEETQVKAAAGLDRLIMAAEAIRSGSSGLLEGLNTASSRTGELAGGLGQLGSASGTLSGGLETVSGGSASLAENLNTAADKTLELASGLQRLSTGAGSLTGGLQSVEDGTEQLREGLVSGYEILSGSVKFSPDDMASFVSDPVGLKDNSINQVKCYGEGFAPYFMSLSLWIGTMLMNLAFSIGKKLKLFKSRFMQSYMGSYLVGASLAAVQALILSFVLMQGLGITPVTVPGFYFGNIFVAVVFFSMMHGVSNTIGILGAPVMFILLLLQLASSGGTFPIETAPAFYRAINGVIPMTYSVNALRAIVSGANATLLGNNIAVLLVFMTASLASGALIRLALNHANNKTGKGKEKKVCIPGAA